MLVLDDILLIGLAPVLGAAAAYLLSRSDDDSPGAPAAGSAPGDPAACRAAVPPVARLSRTSAGSGGYMYSGTDPDHIAWVRQYLSSHADAASDPDEARRIRAFLALQGREGSTSAVNSYDNQILTLGTGWSGLGSLPRVMGHLTAASPDYVAALAACGVTYLGQGQWSVTPDGGGEPVVGKAEGLHAFANYTDANGNPSLLALFIHLAETPGTREPVADAQLQAWDETSGNVDGASEIATQALFNFATHLKHWAPGYMAGTVSEAAAAVPSPPSADRDRQLAPLIVEGFYRRAAGKWVPSWSQMQRYALRDMKDDGLDLSGDPVLSASAPPVSQTVAGCGEGPYYDVNSPDDCVSAAPWRDHFRLASGQEPYPEVRIAGPGDPGAHPAGNAAGIWGHDNFVGAGNAAGVWSPPITALTSVAGPGCGNVAHFSVAGPGRAASHAGASSGGANIGGAVATHGGTPNGGYRGWRPGYPAHDRGHAWFYASPPAYYDGALGLSDGCVAVAFLPDGTLACAGDLPVALPPGVVVGLDGVQVGVAQAVPQGYMLVPIGYEGAYEIADENAVPQSPYDASPATFTSSPNVMAGAPPSVANAPSTFVSQPNARVTPPAEGKSVGGPGGPGNGPGTGWGEVRPDPRDVTVGGPGAGDAGSIVDAVRAGAHDPPVWVDLRLIAPDGTAYDLVVTAEPIAVGGVRLPTSFDDAFAVASLLGALPITPAISDARWNDPGQADRAPVRREPAQPLNDPSGAKYNDAGQVARYNERMGPNTGQLTDGYWKEIVVVPGLASDGPRSMAQYGFKRADGSMYEHGGPSNHDRHYKDYSDTPTYVGRSALRNGVSIDVLDEYAAGGGLGPALEPWLIERLRNGG